MTITEWTSLFLVCLLGASSPGPSLAVVISNTMRAGKSAGFASAIAHGVGVGLYGLLTVSGLALVVTQSPAIFVTVQVAGALYLMWLGSKALRGAMAAKKAGNSVPEKFGSEVERSVEVGGVMGAVKEGFGVAFLNPKLAVFMLALFSQFLTATTTVSAKGIMVATVGITDAAWYSFIVLMVSHPAVIVRLNKHSILLDTFFGLVLVLLGAAVILRVLLSG